MNVLIRGYFFYLKHFFLSPLLFIAALKSLSSFLSLFRLKKKEKAFILISTSANVKAPCMFFLLTVPLHILIQVVDDLVPLFNDGDQLIHQPLLFTTIIFGPATLCMWRDSVCNKPYLWKCTQPLGMCYSFTNTHTRQEQTLTDMFAFWIKWPTVYIVFCCLQTSNFL